LSYFSYIDCTTVFLVFRNQFFFFLFCYFFTYTKKRIAYNQWIWFFKYEKIKQMKNTCMVTPVSQETNTILWYEINWLYRERKWMRSKFKYYLILKFYLFLEQYISFVFLSLIFDGLHQTQKINICINKNQYMCFSWDLYTSDLCLIYWLIFLILSHDRIFEIKAILIEIINFY